MIKLGTHNSLSYLPCQWWLRPFVWVGRCQSKTILEQYEIGVRWFDIRVKYVNSKAISGHGLLTYNIDVELIFAFLNTTGDCIVRIYLENSYFNPMKHFERFSTDIRRWQKKYPRLRFVEGGCRFYYKRLIEDKPDTRDCYWKKRDTLLPYPKGYAKTNNKTNHKNDNEKEFSVYDFVEI